MKVHSVESHFSGRTHTAKVLAKQGGPIQLDETYVSQGIISGDGVNGVPVGQLRCQVCDAGATVPTILQNLAAVDLHCESKKHQKKMGTTEAAADAGSLDKIRQTIEAGVWNLPDYVMIEDTTLTCTLCNSTKMTVFQHMVTHLGSERHARKCRDGKHEEIIFNAELRRLEHIISGRPVVRHGSTKPSKYANSKEKKSSSSADTTISQPACCLASAASSLPVSTSDASLPLSQADVTSNPTPTSSPFLG